MSDYNRDAVGWTATMTHAEQAVIDQGLRAYMLRVYNYMFFGLAITGLAALAIYMLAVTDQLANASHVIRSGRVLPVISDMTLLPKDVLLTAIGYTIFVSPLKWAVIMAPLALVFGLTFSVERMRPATAQMLFWLYAALIGLSLGSIFIIYTHTSITRVFFISAAAFGGLSLLGYTTQKDLSGIGAFLIMGLIGVIIAGLVNLALASTALQFAISIIGVLVFAGLTAYDTQRLKNEYLYVAMDAETAERSAVMGALALYLDFLNLFTLLLQLLGQRDD